MNNHSGQSILELLIGASLIVVVLLGGVILTTRSLQLADVAANREKAIQFARQGVEKIRADRNRLPWTELISLENEEEDFEDKIIFSRTIEIIELPVGDPERNRKCEVWVTVAWSDAKGNHTVDQKTVLTNW